MKLKDWKEHEDRRRDSDQEDAGFDFELDEGEMDFEPDDRYEDFLLDDDAMGTGLENEEPTVLQKRPGMILRKEMPGEWDDDWEEDEENGEEELPPLKPWARVLIFLGLAVLAAIICAILWYIVHPDLSDGDSGDPNPTAEATATPDMVIAPSEDSESGSAQEETPASGEKPGPDLILEPTPMPGTEGTSEPDTDADLSSTQEPAPEAPSEEASEPVDGDIRMKFQDIQDSVTPKDVVNLRSIPTTQDAETIMAQARNGETLTRIGINENTGWSKLEYDGQVLYAVSAYLTTDLDYVPPLKPSDPNRVDTISGRIIIFQDCDDWISPKEYVNLRTEPSTTEGDSTVSCQLNNGEKAHRTGYSIDSGWSRVEYNGQVLYVVTSLVNKVETD